MTVHVSGRSISALLLLSVSLLGLPAEALAQSVVTPQKAAPTLAERSNDPNDRATLRDVLSAPHRLHARMAFARKSTEAVRDHDVTPHPGGVRRATMRTTGSVQVERVEAGVELAPDTFTLQPSTASGRGR